MKKLLLISIISLFSTLLAGQNVGKWVLPTSTAGSTSNFIPKELNFSNLSLTDNYVQYGYNVPCVAVLGGYAPNFDRRFIIHETYLSWTSTNNIQWSGSTNNFSPELQVIQKFGAQNDYYIFYGCKGCYWSDFELDFFGFRLLSHNGSGWSSSQATDLNAGGVTNPNRSIGFAITDNANSTRKIYLVSHFKAQNSQIYGCVERWDINSQGPDLASRTSLLDAGYPYLTLSVEDFFAYNVEVKTDNNGNDILAWIVSDNTKSKYLYVYNVTAGGLNKFDLGQGRIAGIEFAPGNNSWIYVSATNATGILKVDYTTGNILGTLSGSQNYKRTFLQTAPDGNIYACSNDGGNLGRIVTSTGAFQANSVSFGNKFLDTYVLFGSEKYYLLPEDHSPYVPHLTATFTSTYTAPCQNTGTATVTATGGTAPYTYQWYQLINNQPVLLTGYTSATANNLEYGTYQCVVTDAYGYTITVTIVINYDPNVIVTGLNYIANGTHTNETKIFERGFIVQAGSTVTLNNCNYQFMPGAKVIVEDGTISGYINNPTINVSGGVLILDATTFKSVPACNNRWQGIEVWGERTAHQATVAGKCAQGKLITRNNSIIQDAICAVALWQPGNWNTTGGIINASSTWFTNNTKSLHALEYDNYVPTNDSIKVLVSNVSGFTNCTFNITSSYMPGSPAQVFYKHVDLSKVNGLKFRGCDFSIPPGINSNINLYNMAIGCYNAGFHLDAPCTNTTVPCTNYDWNNFNNFYAAVYASNTGINNNTFSVVRANFTNNAIGIYVNGVKNESIFFNNFYLGPNYGDDCAEGSAPSFGINMLNSNGFAIEENTFQKASGAPTGQYVGIRCKDSKTENDVIYKNRFTGLSYGNYAEGENRPSGSGHDLKGLQFQCNLNQNNAVDFIVAKDLMISNPPPPFIHTYQGKPELEAGNTFSANPIPEGSFMNKGTQVINYFYRTNPPVSFTPLLIVPIDNAGINTCPSHYGGGASGDLLVLSNEAKLQKETDFVSNLTNFNNVKALFDNLKDGGNTDGLKLDVETSWPTEMWDLRADLLEKSPYLSQEVLMAAADKTEVLPESILFEILSANPDELRKEELLAYLENKEQPLPDYMISILRQLAGGITYKTALMMDMSTYHAKKTQSAYDLIRSALADSVTDYQYLRTWFGNLDNLHADYDIVAAYLAEGNYTATQTKIESIPVARAMEGTELNMFYDYKDLILLQIGWEQQGIAITQLDSSTVASLVGYAESGTGKASLMARAILEYGYGYHFNCCIPENNPSTLKRASFNKSADVNGLQLNVSPNPASTWVAFDYKLPIPTSEGLLLITDMSGKAIANFNLKMPQGQQVWDTRGVSKGTYLYVLKAGNASKQGKIIVK